MSRFSPSPGSKQATTPAEDPKPVDEATLTPPASPTEPNATQPAATELRTEPTPATELQPDPNATTIATTPDTTGATQPSVKIPTVAGAREEVAALQILLDRGGSSPGVIDGRFGSNVDRAIAAYRRMTGTNLKSTDTALHQAASRRDGWRRVHHLYADGGRRRRTVCGGGAGRLRREGEAGEAGLHVGHRSARRALSHGREVISRRSTRKRISVASARSSRVANVGAES